MDGNGTGEFSELATRRRSTRALGSTIKKPLWIMPLALAILAAPIISGANDRLPPKPVFLSEITYSGVAPEPFGPLFITLKMEREELAGLTIEVHGTIIEVDKALLEGLTNPREIEVGYPGSGKVDQITIGFEFGFPYRVNFDRDECDPVAQEVQLRRDAVGFTINEQYEVSKQIHSDRDSNRYSSGT